MTAGYDCGASAPPPPAPFEAEKAEIVPYSAEAIFNGANPKRGRNALHLALSENDSDAAKGLIEEGDALMLNMPSPQGCTPLMLLAMGHCEEALIWRLLERSGSISIAMKSESRRTAADYAETYRDPAVAKALRDMEVAEMARTAQFRCDICGDVVRKRPLLAYFSERAVKGEEDNEMLQRFFASGNQQELMKPHYHQINHDKKQRKELSESIAVLEALDDVLPEFNGDWHVIDLCCGKSMTSALVSLRHPGVTVSAVDRLPARFLPHYNLTPGCGVKYIELDVLGDGFIAELSALIASSGRPAVLLGMHLCGWLSTRAIDAFAQLDTIRALVLSPCCLPNKTHVDSPPELYASKDADTQYAAWASLLETRLQHAAPADAAVVRSAVPQILSPKNVVITAVRAGSTKLKS